MEIIVAKKHQHASMSLFNDRSDPKSSHVGSSIMRVRCRQERKALVTPILGGRGVGRRRGTKEGGVYVPTGS